MQVTYTKFVVGCLFLHFTIVVKNSSYCSHIVMNLFESLNVQEDNICAMFRINGLAMFSWEI